MRSKSSYKNRCVSAALCALMAVIECAAPAPGQSRTAVEIDRESPRRAEARVKTDHDIFDFRSSFWMKMTT
jgi:hypothetical protein